MVLTQYAVGDKMAENRLARGFFEAHGDWRYTARNFALTVDVPQPVAATLLDLDFNVPGESIQAVSDVTMTCRFNGQEILKRKFTTPGRRFVEIKVPPPLLTKSPAEIDCELDKTYRDEEYKRERALIMVGLEMKHSSEVVEAAETDTKKAHDAYHISGCLG